MAKRVVLAYSGGLDTSVAVRWMIENWGVQVVCVAVDVGQSDIVDPAILKERAKAAKKSNALKVGAASNVNIPKNQKFASGTKGGRGTTR